MNTLHTQAALAAENARWDIKRNMWALCLPSAENRAGINIAQRWQFLDFLGSRGTKSRGVVDILGISRDHRPAPGVLRRADLFEIVLIRVKGETAPWPTTADVKRLRAVQRRYRAKAVVLASWEGGPDPAFHVLRRSNAQGRKPWCRTSPAEAFGARCRSSRLK
ncbi:MAG: hypothetical protein ACLQIJ_23015 [Polyangia bacterium]